MDTGNYIITSVFFICLFAGLAAIVKEHEKANVRTVCYAAQAEAMRQHVEFKQDCSK